MSGPVNKYGVFLRFGSLVGLLAVMFLIQAPRVFAASACFQVSWTVGLAQAVTYSNASDCAVDRERQILYVSDFQRILRYDFNGNHLITDFMGFDHLYGMAIGPDSYLYLGEYDQQVVKVINSSGQLMGIIGSAMGHIRGVAVDKNGDVYAANEENQVIELQRLGGPYCDIPQYLQARLTLQGDPSGGLDTPTGLLKEGTMLYVADQLHSRIVAYQQVGSTFTYNYSMDAVSGGTSPGQIQGPFRIATDLAGNFYVTSGVDNRLVIFDSGWNFIRQGLGLITGFANGIVLDNNGNQYLTTGNTIGRVDGGCLAQPTATQTPFTPVPTCTPTGTLTPSQTPTPSATPTSTSALTDTAKSYIYPSPVRGKQGTVCYKMEESGRAIITVWNESAEKVLVVRDSKPTGVQTTALNLSGFPSGVYYYQVAIQYASGGIARSDLQKFVHNH